ncbi:DNA-binding response regulator [Paenibacillus contaminans]|uniref:DNA-binding response regulator n=1 Tax=Paenibacillus contaminans TaxID=450362 RepID=A0A329MHY2_9BACL|nr:DNA-binding response regulator [Paenibacillus contaminans]
MIFKLEKKKHVLIIDDEPKIVEVIKAYLERDGWRTTIAYDGDTGLKYFQQDQPNLIILDLMLAGMPGEELCKRMRERSTVPIIMITSKSRENDRINGLYLGADDYIVKPFSPNELVARAHAVFRRAALYVDQGHGGKLSFNQGQLVFDHQKMKVIVKGKDANLTKTEFKILSAMSVAPEKVFTRADLLYHVQGYRFIGDPRLIDAHIKNIRHKVEDNPREAKVLVTVIGAGYKFGGSRDG